MAQAELLAVPRPRLAPQPALAWTVDIRVISVVDLDSGYVRDKKAWTQRVGLANVSPKGLYHCIKGWFKLDNGR